MVHDSNDDHIHQHQHGQPGHHHPINQNFYSRTFIIAIALNTVYVVLEFLYGFIANSAALIADAGHNLSDVLALMLAWMATKLARKAPSGRYTYGLRSTSILAALINSMFLLIICGGIAWEAFQRLFSPPVIAGMTVTLVAAAGIIINGFSALLFIKGSKKDLNIRGAYLHMAADAAVSLGVMLAGMGVMLTNWYWLDPAISLIIVIVIVIGTWGLLKESVQLVLNAVPAGIDIPAIDDYLRHCPGVTGIHDLHIWGMSTTESALTVHLVMPNGYPGDIFMDEIMQTLHTRFDIHHSTIQIELGTSNHACILQADNVISHNH